MVLTFLNCWQVLDPFKGLKTMVMSGHCSAKIFAEVFGFPGKTGASSLPEVLLTCGHFPARMFARLSCYSGKHWGQLIARGFIDVWPLPGPDVCQIVLLLRQALGPDYCQRLWAIVWALRLPEYQDSSGNVRAGPWPDIKHSCLATVWPGCSTGYKFLG